MSAGIDRRGFLKSAAALMGSLSMPNFVVQAATLQNGGLPAVPLYTSWKDVYRSQWTWDKVVRSTHHLNCWFQAHCSWDVYVKDDIVYREEQAGEYEQVNAELPDYNPRGCQKGGCFSERMYDPSRITHPLRRVGPRGGGKWERVSWDEALADIADTYLDVTLEEGTDRTIWDLGPGIDLGVSMAAQGRFSMLTQSIGLDMDGEIGDSRRGTLETFGKIVFERSADDYFYSDLILFWGGNPVYTQIPQAHFFTEARYRGAKIISIAPDYNPSATKPDLWVPIKPGTDAALALAICHEIVAGGHVKEAFVKEQTDLPLLVRSDTLRFLKQADVEEGGHEDHHMLWDARTDSPHAAPFRSLALEGLDPMLDVVRIVRLKDDRQVEVRSVFSLLRDRLADYTPEEASAMCGVTPKMIRRLAREIVSADKVSNIAQTSLCKYFHGNLAERSMALIFALTGNIGRRGAGFSGFPLLTPDGGDKFAIPPSLQEAAQTFGKLEPLIQQRIEAGDTHEMVITDLGRMMFVPGNKLLRLPVWTSGTLFWSVHGGVGELSKHADEWGLGNKRPLGEYLDESLAKQWQPLNPPPDRPPRIMISLCSNTLRRARGSEKLLEVLWPKLKKIVVMDWRINSTARHADYVLPVAPWYERTSLKWVTPLSPYLTITDQATKPLGESKSDWGIIVALSEAIQKRARARGIQSVQSPQGLEVKLDTLYDDLTMNGQFKEGDDDKVARTIYDLGGTHKKLSWDEIKEKGFARFEKLPEEPSSIGNMCEFPENDSIVPLTFHVRDKVPYPTSSRRIQFFVDHPFYEELDELLPRFKAPPMMGGNYPLMMTGGKTRWSIHSTWRDSRIMLRLEARPEPYMLVSMVDATQRGIVDGDWIRVWNDVGRFKCKAKVSSSLRPGQTLMYHAWEHYQFSGGGDMNSVSPTPLNPVELAGGHPHLAAGVLQGQNSVFDRDTRIEIERIAEGAPA
ncbi:molybdopterin-dependent oxidoreductase [Aromatoleum aromaticum]|uniref:molybdopterin-dependent oxidoreductase n=1 Tax=Aromatoleum aromaticum TaxID=551760 RepID=UPI001459CD36|nr:molybdopterin-dependent oxidoreductase [Aromatoleum aromaticum]NMG56002.1 molybdopterin-dependent oxidoreductase [Aromatoleum aromaticum]